LAKGRETIAREQASQIIAALGWYLIAKTSVWEIEYKLEHLAARCRLGHPLGLSVTDFCGPSTEAKGLFGVYLAH
jgi:hypothetical protein